MQLNFSYKDTCGISCDVLHVHFKELIPAIEEVHAALSSGYASDYASINLPADRAIYDAVQKLVDEKKHLKPTALVLVGIGGSNMGLKAIHEALCGTLYNEQSPSLKIYYADTVDADHVGDMLRLVEQELQREQNVLLVIVSKSGTTIETIANAELFLAKIKKYKQDSYAESVVAITDEGSRLWHVAQERGFACLPIPQKVGGRFSVFSAVGLFPLAMLGIDIKQLLQGAQSVIPLCTSLRFDENSAAVSAIIRAVHYRAKMNINDLFIFNVDSAAIGAWYRQLMGESIGKEYNRLGQRVHSGITPTVSIGSIDLHSVAQLYLGGPRDKLTMFLNSEQHQTSDLVPHDRMLRGCADMIEGRSLSSIMQAIMQGTQAAYAHDKRPFTAITLGEKTPFAIGQLLQWYMFEIIYLGFLFDVNPFDQPNVQAYKKETERILSGCY